MTKTLRKIILSLISFPMVLFGISRTNALANDALITPDRTITITQNVVDYTSTFKEFDNPYLLITEKKGLFCGDKTFNYSDFASLDLISEQNIDDDINVHYEAVINRTTNEVSLKATLQNGNEKYEEILFGEAFINKKGDPDAILNVEEQQILLSDLQDISYVENCGWLSKIITTVVTTVVVCAAVAATMVTGGAALGAIVGTCAIVGAITGSVSCVIAGCIEGECEIGQIATNFGVGMTIGAAVGALTGFCVGKIGGAINKSVGFEKGSFSNINDSVNYHFKKHGSAVGAKNTTEYVKQAIKCARDVIKNGVKPIRAVAGSTANVYRYEIAGKFIHMAIDESKIIIVSFGAL